MRLEKVKIKGIRVIELKNIFPGSVFKSRNCEYLGVVGLHFIIVIVKH